jgi:Arc/MetJ-type ribon-helix-helix transcriptional regulator
VNRGEGQRASTNVPIPPEFEASARGRGRGRYSSEPDDVADALKQYLADREALLLLLDPAIEQLDRGEGRPFDAEETKRRGRERRRRAGACPR